MKKKLVIFCGGRGATTILRELIKDESFSVTAIVNAFDDGKSSGVIRNAVGMLGPSDIRKLQLLFADRKKDQVKALAEVFTYRCEKKETLLTLLKSPDAFFRNFLLTPADIDFLKERFTAVYPLLVCYDREEGFEDFSLGNCVYAGSFLLNNCTYQKMIKEIHGKLSCRAEVLNVSDENVFLTAIGKQGKVYRSEWEIDNAYNEEFDEIFLTKPTAGSAGIKEKGVLRELRVSPPMSPLAIDRIAQADVIVFGPGTTSTSLLPTLMTNGIGDVIRDNKRALKIFISNIAAEYTHHWKSPFDEIDATLFYLKNKGQVQDYIKMVLIDTRRMIIEKDNVPGPYNGLSFINTDLASDNGSEHNGVKVAGLIKNRLEQP